jgi:hypothetical protein
VETVPVTGKWAPRLYGFAELDATFDSTQSFSEQMSDATVARDGTYAENHKRFMLSARHSRIGFRFATPESDGIKGSATIEADFLGNQPTTATENQTFTNPAARLRHAWLKLETPIVDVLFGQTWQLLGWQPYFDPNTVEIQGVPGQVYSRAPQIRLSHIFKFGAVSLEIAVAGSRPPQRDAGTPDGQAGIRFKLDDYKAVRTLGATGTQADALAIGVSGALRHFGVANFSATPSREEEETGWAVSADAFVPIIPASMNDRGNALTLTGSYARGKGDADFYSGLTGGITFPALPNPAMMTPAPTYTPNIDNGLVTFDAAGFLHTIEWQSFIIGLQYYLPPSGRVWITGNYSHTNSPNMDELGPPDRVFNLANWFAGAIFWDATEALRFGVEYAWTGQSYVDGNDTHNHRGHIAGYYIF